MKKRRSLATFAAERKTGPGPKCWVCQIPEVQEVNQGIKDGMRPVAIVDWLRDDCGYGEQATKQKLFNHTSNRHYLR